MTGRITFSVAGEPSAKGRPRGSARIVEVDGKPTAILSMHTPAETVAAEKVVRDTFALRFPKHERWTRAVMLRFVAVFPIPRSWPKYMQEAARRGTLYHTSKPDKDNIEKLIVDALNGLAWVDDAQVQGGGIKRYGHPARIDVTLEPIEQPDVPATPGQRATERRIEAGEHVGTPKRRTAAKKPSAAPAHDRANPPKLNKTKYPPKLREAIDAALAKGGGR